MKVLIILLTFFVYENVFSEDIQYYTKDNTLFITNPFDHRTYTIESISTHGSAVFHMKGEIEKLDGMQYAKKSNKENKNKEDQSKENINLVQVTKYILQSQKHYEEGRMKDSWEALELAEEFSEKDYRVKKMKGSLLMELGDQESAIKYWKESLDINPNQPDIKSILNKIENGL